MIYFDNRFLTLEEMTINANYILNYLVPKGWTKNAICGMLGNMQTESTINPGIWQNLDSGNTDLGFGLVQWTPATKYLEWADRHGYSATDINGQLARLDYEIEMGLQWLPTSQYPLTFEDFKKSNRTPEYLAQAFLKCYERPQEQNQPLRSTQARYWFDTLTGGSGNPNEPCVQLAKFPMDRIQITQGENGQYSHMGIKAIDFVGTHTKYPYYAPCDCECVASFNDVAVWRSIHRVMCADGQVRKIFWSCIHEVPLSHSLGSILFKGELMGHTGVGGTATGDHLHLQVMLGDKYEGFTRNSQGASTLVGTELSIYDVFAVNDVKIVDGYDYEWKTSDYIDCSEGGEEKPEKKKLEIEYVGLLLCDAINGWKF